MDNLSKKQQNIKKLYDQGGSPLAEILDLSQESIRSLRSVTRKQYGTIKTKQYFAFSHGNNISRPVLSSLLVDDEKELEELWNAFFKSINGKSLKSTLESISIDRLIYTTVMSFACCIDLWKPKSRKTPGTHLEIVLGSVLSQFVPKLTRSKFISLPDQAENVSTDIVFKGQYGGLVIPAKTTTRERIVQPYAHQRILDSVFNPGVYKSILMCVSETQRDDKSTSVKEICVPGTIKLFQAHLSSLSGIYYLDPPTRYLRRDVTSLVPVKRYSDLFTNDLKDLLRFTEQAPLDNN